MSDCEQELCDFSEAVMEIEKAIWNEIAPGMHVGYWTVLDDRRANRSGELQWYCRCDCGTERYVLDRSLRYGGSISCGCLRRQKSRERAYDLTSKVFGDLTVIGRSPKKKAGTGVWWLCQCKCGKLYETQGTLLVTGKRTHCGCRQDLQNYAYVDITNHRFNRLTALFPTQSRDAAGSVIWHCRCDCGNEVDVSYNCLRYTNLISCGCRKLEHDQELNELIARADGTSIDHLRSQKIPANNTTGVRGVYLIKGKYVAKIVFQKKQYFLGTYKTIDAAAEARHEAEEELAGKAVSFYEQWKTKADADPEWVAMHPVQFSVVRENGRLRLETLPKIDGVQLVG